MKLVVSGPNAIEAVLQHGLRVTRAWATESKSIPDALQGIAFKRVRSSDLDGILRHQNHQGLAVETDVPVPDAAAMLEQVEVEASGPLVICERIEDPHNLGAIVRAAVGLGAAGVIISNRKSAQLTDAVVRSSVGVALGFPPAIWNGSIAALLLQLQQRGWQTVGLALEGRPIAQVASDLGSPWALVVGNEARGLSHLARERCSDLARIPLAPAVESLNASVACGVGMALLQQGSQSTVI